MLLPNCRGTRFGGGSDLSITKRNVIAVICEAIYKKKHGARKANATRQAAHGTNNSFAKCYCSTNFPCSFTGYNTTKSSTSSGSQRCNDATRKAILFNSFTIKGVVT
ncbi:hypothetical protein [Endozoicomonas sp. GU-1]|uniref:hypothetical protein n=1 Tax=Endozoicomonas sp. GU-1 TaxID=3009078 RepID=UPI0022B33EF1|nr:hypothetical protein [Endozoicomonas sp. GU-1]WBA80264.1 hypothetical protein O2T12_18255 [Endozoicomonas sp. GU-1]